MPWLFPKGIFYPFIASFIAEGVDLYRCPSRAMPHEKIALQLY
jgi:hypothetical protein